MRAGAGELGRVLRRVVVGGSRHRGDLPSLEKPSPSALLLAISESEDTHRLSMVVFSGKPTLLAAQ